MSIGKRNGSNAMRPMVGLAMVLAACGGSDDDGPPAWDPAQSGDGTGASSTSVDPGTTGSRPDDDGDATTEDSTGGGSSCTPGESITCMCPDGSQSEQVCNDDGTGFAPCECEDGEDSTGDSGEPGSTSDSGEMQDVVCYPGPANDFTTCLPLHSFEPMPEGYEYPPPYMGNDNYRAPIALLDLEEVDPATYLAPNFRLDEIAQAWKGRYAVVQPHAVVSLQSLRDQVGAITVNSGYRSPAYNATLDGSATYSRHMYGDSYDLDPLEVALSTLEQICTADGGMLVEYMTHVHCDFRFDPVDEQFFGPPMAAAPTSPPHFDATLVHDDDGWWSAPATGFDEGAPQRRWAARDADGVVVATAVAERFWAPAAAVTVEVRVGAQVERSVASR